MHPKTMYYVLSAMMAVGFGFTCVSYGPFLESIGLSYAEFGLINVVFWVVIIGAELPTGAMADGRSRSWSVAMSGFFYAIGALTYFFAHNVWGAMLGEAIVGIASAFMSGAKQAWMVDALKRSGLVDEELKKAVKKTFAMDKIIGGSLIFVCGLLGDWLTHFLPARVIWLPLVFAGLGTWWLASRHMNGHGEPDEKISEMEAIKRSFVLLKQSRALIWVAACLILFGFIVTFNHYWSVYFTNMFGPSSRSYAWLIMYPAVPLAGFLIRSRHVLDKREETGILTALFLSGLGMLLLPVFSSWAFVLPMVVVHELGRGMFEPLSDAFIQHRVPSSYRATFGSLQSLIGRIGFAIVPLGTWFFLRGQPNTNETIAVVWIVCGGLLVFGTIVLYFFRPRVET